MFRDELTATLVTREQRGRGHVLVIPIEHRETILDLSPHEEHVFMGAISRAARMVAASYDPDGIAVWQNNGTSAHQSVPHVHFHVAATLPEGGTKWGPVPEMTVEETDALANLLRHHDPQLRDRVKIDVAEDPCDKTIETYRQTFDKYVERTRDESQGEFREWLDSFAAHIPKEGVILEIGSASGRDARYFASKGFKVICTDVIPEALQRLSDEGFETAEFDFRSTPKPEWANKFDGLFANAVLLHAPPNAFEVALRNIALVLKENGVAAFSLKAGEGEEISLEKLEAPRYFRSHTEPEIRDILSKLPFDIISVSHAEQGNGCMSL